MHDLSAQSYPSIERREGSVRILGQCAEADVKTI